MFSGVPANTYLSFSENFLLQRGGFILRVLLKRWYNSRLLCYFSYAKNGTS